MITVLTCRGTGEPLGSPANMLAAVTGKLDPAKFEIAPDIDYPAAVGPVDPQADIGGCSEQRSIELGVTSLAAAVRRTPNRVGILGYSLGAEVVTRFLEAKARGEYPDCSVVWTATIANPLRQEGDSIDVGSAGFGINGPHGPWPKDIVSWEVANPADGITSCPADSPLRTMADAVSAFSFAELGGWTTDLADRIRRNRWQPDRFGYWLHPVETWNLWSRAANLMAGYLCGGAHNSAYLTGGYCDRLVSILDMRDD